MAAFDKFGQPSDEQNVGVPRVRAPRAASPEREGGPQGGDPFQPPDNQGGPQNEGGGVRNVGGGGYRPPETTPPTFPPLDPAFRRQLNQPPMEGADLSGDVIKHTSPGDPREFIRNWQQTHPASEGIGPLADALKSGGYDVGRYMYGNTPSNNELSLNGSKFKVLGAEDSPNTAFWYQGGNDSAPQTQFGGGFQFNSNLYGPAQLPFNLPTTDFATYKPGTLTRYQPRDFSQLEGTQNAALQKALQSGSLSPEVIAQMQGQLHDQALTMQKGQQQNIHQLAANQNMLGSGGEMANIQNIGNQTQQNLLGGYRDIDVAAARTNYQDILNALGMSENVMSGQLGRGLEQYRTGFGTEMAQEGLNQAGVQSQNAATQFALQRALESANLGFNYNQLGQNQNQFLNNLGFNYANLNANQSNTQMNALLRALGM